MAGKANHRGFGHTRRLPSKRWQASYIGPDLARYNAPSTFDAKEDAEGWLAGERKLIQSGEWQSPVERRAARDAKTLTLAAYASSWLAERELKPRTAANYRQLLDRFVVPSIGNTRISSLTPAAVRAW